MKLIPSHFLFGILALAPPALAFDFTFLSATNPTPNNAAEVVTYTKDGFLVGATFSDTTNANPALHSYGAITYQLNANGSLSNETVINFQSFFPAASVIQTAFDPLGRGFGVVSLSPTADQDVLGRIGFYNYRTGQVFGTMEVGFHPDGLAFSPDGTRLIVANEAEHPLDFATSGKSTPGSLSVIDLSNVIDVSLGAPTQDRHECGSWDDGVGLARRAHLLPVANEAKPARRRGGRHDLGLDCGVGELELGLDRIGEQVRRGGRAIRRAGVDDPHGVRGLARLDQASEIQAGGIGSDDCDFHERVQSVCGRGAGPGRAGR